MARLKRCLPSCLDSSKYKLKKHSAYVNKGFDLDEETISSSNKGRQEDLASLHPGRILSPVNILALTSGRWNSLITLSWISKIIWRLGKKGFHEESEWALATADSAKHNANRLEKLWQEELKKYDSKDASFARVLFRFQCTQLVIACIIIIVTFSSAFVGPTYLVYRILLFILQKNEPVSIGVGLFLALTFSEISRICMTSLAWNINIISGIRLRGALLSMILRKLMKVPSLNDKRMGEIINLSTNDAQVIFEATANGLFVLAAPITAAITAVSTTLIMGYWALLGSFIFLLILPFQLIIVKFTAQIRKKAFNCKDKRIYLTNNFLNNIKFIKMYAWEKCFADKITDVRIEESKFIKKANFLQSISITLFPIMPIVSVTVTFVAHIVSGNVLTALQAFTVLTIFNFSRGPLGMLTHSVRALTDAYISCERVKNFLIREEIETSPLGSDFNKPVVLSNVSFATAAQINSKDNFIENNLKQPANIENNLKEKADIENNLKETTKIENNLKEKANIENNSKKNVSLVSDISLEAKKGDFIGIFGLVGSGKTSLLMGILGELKLVAGKLDVSGSIAFVSQKAWLFNCTIRENIIFGRAFDEEKYNEIIFACGLEEDLNGMVGGDLTIVSGNGLTLSGGQKQRINLARALYSDSDIYLLDDPFSSIDCNVSQHVFIHSIRGILKEKTVFLVTHNLQYLKSCDYIINLKNGKLEECNSFDDIINNGEYSELLDKRNRENNDSLLPQTIFHNQPSSSNKFEESLSMKENMQPTGEKQDFGFVSLTTYLHYLRSSGSYFFSILVYLIFIIYMAFPAFNSIWISHWLPEDQVLVENETFFDNQTFNFTNQSSVDYEDEAEKYEFWLNLLIFGLTLVAMVLLGPIKSYLFIVNADKASVRVHNKMLRKTVSCSMSFFDVTPVGTILDKFSKDLEEVDSFLPFFLESTLQAFLQFAFSIVLVIYIIPWFLIPFVPLLIIACIVDYYCTLGMNEVKRINNITRSDVVGHLASCFEGLPIIRCFGMHDLFVEKFEHDVDNNTVPFSLASLSISWYALRMDTFAVSMVAAVTLILLASVPYMTVNFAGLALACIFQIILLFQYMMRLKSECISRFISFERIQTFTQSLIAESSKSSSKISKSLLREDWPSKGKIIYQKVELKYQENLPLVLQNISFEIQSEEKIGIVGRTGSGKSSLIQALFRLVELSSGRILIDGMDISEIPLWQLRSKISLIPQDPILFAGTIRYNLDPFNEHTDDVLWDILEKVQLKNRILSESKQLETILDDTSDYFSLGQKQLLCLVRALLRNSKILVLDEATASVDLKTESLLQNIIKKFFTNCTVLIVAHRLNTVMSCNRIMVLSNGQVVEFNDPEVLLADDQSYFKRMIVGGEVCLSDDEKTLKPQKE